MDKKTQGRISSAAPSDPFGAFCKDNHIALAGSGQGPLAGLTFAVKDVFHIAGGRTGFGHPDWLRTHPPATETAASVRRLLDAGAANPYLMQAGVLLAGLDGIKNKRDPGPRLDINMYTDGHKAKGVRRLPDNLLDAVRLFEKSPVIREGLGAPLVEGYGKLKLAEWKRYAGQITPWERETTLDC